MKWLAIFLSLGCLSSFCAAQYGEPILLVHAQELGWKELSPNPSEKSDVDPGMDARTVTFDHAGNVYIGFLRLNDSKLLERGETTLQFRIVQMNILTGKAEKTLDLPTRSRRRYSMYVTANDLVLGLANDSLQDISGMREDGTVSKLPDAQDWYGISQSVSRKTLLIRSGFSLPKSYLVFDTQSLNIEKRCIETRRRDFYFSIADSSAISTTTGSNAPHGVVRRGPLCGEHQIIRDLPKRFPWVWALGETRYLLSEDSRLEVASDDRGELFHYSLPKNERFQQSNLRFSENGERAAIRVETYRGSPDSLINREVRGPQALRIQVYSLSGPNEIQSISVQSSAASRWANGNWPDFDLSPDGKQLAVFNNGTLRVYALP
jgi:hypothetical protein